MDGEGFHMREKGLSYVKNGTVLQKQQAGFRIRPGNAAPSAGPS